MPISQVTRVGGQQKGQLNTPGMASLMVNGKPVMVQGSPAMIQGQATFIPSQGPLLSGLQGAQTALKAATNSSQHRNLDDSHH